MIGSVAEFAKLVESDQENDYMRAMTDVAPTFVWEEIVRKRPDLSEQVVSNQNVPDSVIEMISLVSSWRARYIVASASRTPSYVLAHLVKDGDSRVQRAALSNARTPLRLIGQMRHDTDMQIAQLAQLVWEDRTEKRSRHSAEQTVWDVPPPPDTPIPPDSHVGRYTSYFDELVAERGMNSSQIVRGFDPRDPQLPLPPEQPWVVAPWGENYVVGSQRGCEFAIYETVATLEAAVDLVYQLVTEAPAAGALPEDAPHRGRLTAEGIAQRTAQRDGKPGSNELNVGDILDCLDDDRAQFLFAFGTPLMQRGIRKLPDKPYRAFSVIAPLPMAVLEGLTAGTSSTTGGGAIVVLDRPLRWYLDNHFLLELR